jgi:hypothetical protein
LNICCLWRFPSGKRFEWLLHRKKHSGVEMLQYLISPISSHLIHLIIPSHPISLFYFCNSSILLYRSLAAKGHIFGNLFFRKVYWFHPKATCSRNTREF